ncbi:MAG: hypothetical protein KBT04_04070 [Bacteroidales bacterium]|nr:hypothetical protein [Candidatus Colimorpha onthohippi]
MLSVPFGTINIPDLLGFQHGNFLGLSFVAQLIIILVLTCIMEFFNYNIRNRDKSNYYPYLYVTLTLSLLAVYYYCFQSGMPLTEYYGNGSTPSLGWFCSPKNVGWLYALIGGALLTFVIYNLFCAIMQVTAEMTRLAEMKKKKKWKEWKYVSWLALFCCALTALVYIFAPKVSAIILKVYMVLLIVSVVAKIISDTRSCRNFGKSLLIGVVYYIGIILVSALMIGCMLGLPYFIVIFAFIFSTVKASKKPVKK